MARPELIEIEQLEMDKNQITLEEKLSESKIFGETIIKALYGQLPIQEIEPRRFLRNPKDLTDKIPLAIALNYARCPDLFRIPNNEIVIEFAEALRKEFGKFSYKVENDEISRIMDVLRENLPEPKDIEDIEISRIRNLRRRLYGTDDKNRLYNDDYKSVLSQTETYFRIFCGHRSNIYSSEQERDRIAIKKTFCKGK